MTLLRRAVSGFSKLPDRLPASGGGILGGMGSGVNNSVGGAMGAYGSVGSIYGLVRRLVESVSLVDWNLYEQDRKGVRTLVDDATAPAQHPATALWTHPNPYMSRQLFLEISESYMLLSGESYWFMTKPSDDDGGKLITPKSAIKAGMELWPITPMKIRPIPGKDRYIAGYLYSNGIEQIPLETGWLVREITPDPMNPMRGLGPIQAVMSDIEAERYAAMWNRNFFMNSAEPGGIIQFDTPLSDVDFERLVTRWREQHQGVANAFRVAILERGTWVDRKITQRDMQWQQLRTVNWEQFRRSIGIAASVMGDNEHSNRATAQTGAAIYAQYVLKPRLERIKQACNEYWLPFFGDNLTLDYVDPTPNDEVQTFNVAIGKWSWGLASLNQTLAALGEPTIDGPQGDQRIYEMIPAAAPKMPSTPPTVTEQQGYLPDVQKSLPDALAEATATMEQAWRKRLAALEDA